MEYTIINDDTKYGADVFIEHITAKDDEDAIYQSEGYISSLMRKRGVVVTLIDKHIEELDGLDEPGYRVVKEWKFSNSGKLED